MGAENVYIYVSYDSNHRKGAVFLQNKHDYKCDIDFIQQFNKQ